MAQNLIPPHVHPGFHMVPQPTAVQPLPVPLPPSSEDGAAPHWLKTHVTFNSFSSLFAAMYNAGLH